MAKPHHDPNAIVWLIFGVLFFVAFAAMLGGCTTVRPLIDACRDGLCR
jgi:hypothetical protein